MFTRSVAAEIGGAGIVYFINMLVVSLYINTKLREYAEKLDFVGQGAKAEEGEDEGEEGAKAKEDEGEGEGEDS